MYMVVYQSYPYLLQMGFRFVQAYCWHIMLFAYLHDCHELQIAQIIINTILYIRAFYKVINRLIVTKHNSAVLKSSMINIRLLVWHM